MERSGLWFRNEVGDMGVLSACFVYCGAYCNFWLQLKELNHDNIKSFVGACVEPGHICYLMQCCSRGTVQVSFYTLRF